MKNIITLKSVGIALIYWSLFTAPTLMAMAGSDTNKQKPLPKHQQGKPPQPAIEICLSKKEDSVCDFQGPHENEKGTCEFTPDKQYFACKPSRQGRQPPTSIENNRVKQVPSHLSYKAN